MPDLRPPFLRGLLVASLAVLAGCTSWSNEIRQAELAYDEARPDAALAWLDVVGDDNLGRMGLSDRARYLYVRGMTEFRLGRRDDALFHLALAREVSGTDGVGLRREQRELMDRTLTELTPTAPMSHRAASPAATE
ncbi:MAG: hypothetical protein K1X94_07020 [Sandaracinaceae bacterium]|nr:hypothetical protein [Sandaracinaceae bacterium]